MDISVIIPIYNVETYLRRCLDSVLSQKSVSMEIILVDGYNNANIHMYYIL